MINPDDKMVPSNYITEFLNFLDEAGRNYNFSRDEEKNQDNLTQDLLHSLELDGLSCGERSKVATRLKKNRQDRRRHKDIREELEPLMDFMSNKENKRCIQQLRETLGKIRRIERSRQYRCYIPRFHVRDKGEDDEV